MLQNTKLDTPAGKIFVHIVNRARAHDVHVSFMPEGSQDEFEIAHVGTDPNEEHSDVEVHVWNSPWSEDYTHSFRIRRCDMDKASGEEAWHA